RKRDETEPPCSEHHCPKVHLHPFTPRRSIPGAKPHRTPLDGQRHLSHARFPSSCHPAPPRVRTAGSARCSAAEPPPPRSRTGSSVGGRVALTLWVGEHRT